MINKSLVVYQNIIKNVKPREQTYTKKLKNNYNYNYKTIKKKNERHKGCGLNCEKE